MTQDRTIEGSKEASEKGARVEGPRNLYFNISLPNEALNEHGRPKAQFGRNKIRTAKYTPLSFLPKNLFHQFHNIANIYFFFAIILGIFPIFGAVNPSLNAAPLLVIVFITGVKDAIEDYRRTVLDNELNNSPVRRLVGWKNVNVNTDNVSAWRKIKKATTRSMKFILQIFIRLFFVLKHSKDKDNGSTESTSDEPRLSVATRTSRRESMYSMHTQRVSTGMAQETGPKERSSTGNARNINPQEIFEAPQHTGDIVNRTLPVSGQSQFQKDYWKNVQVGDFVRIYNHDQIPADVVILSTSDSNGTCYAETKNLDGETNLKLRRALRCGQNVRHSSDCERAQFILESEAPQPNLYQYSGAARWTQNRSQLSDDEIEERRSDDKTLLPSSDMVESISINNLLLRGCTLKNTDWALGVVIFTGADTKIMMNAGITVSKRSRIARELNWNVLVNFFILVIMCFISGLVQGLLWAQEGTSIESFEFGSIGGKPSMDGLITFWAAVILFQNMVPIALYISLELIRTAQAFLIYSDLGMYYEKLDYPCTPKSWNISDDLGQIEYIFSDKTGTLTQNVMEFKKATINGISYGEAYTEALAGMQKREGIDVEEGSKARGEIAMARERMLAETRKLYNNPYLRDEELTFVAPDFVLDLAGRFGDEQKNANHQFMLALALCHTVISQQIPGDPPKIEFMAQSPDEAALVGTARDVGFTLVGNSNNGIHLNVLGEEKYFTVLNVLEFNSTRKRMSTIIRMPDKKIYLFCKGADSVIYSRLKRGEQVELRRQTAEHLEMFAREGLRTLCVAQRILEEDQYQIWNEEFKIAAASVKDREDKLQQVAESIEQDLTLLGGTAIEDRLQEGVPDTIALLAEAGIKLWVLTGDKVETAINIGFSCNLLNNDMELITLSFMDLANAEAELDKYLSLFGMTGSNEELAKAKKIHKPPASTHAIVIDGDSLVLSLEDSLRQKFLLLCMQCKSVLCCRVSPAQKAAVVELVKQSLDVMTLAVGDGANDVAMIQEADVGVGIAGEEGRQAVMSSDYAIGQFRFLQRLLLVHGRWSYRRLGETIANFFYKNIVWTFAIFCYQIYDNFDQTYLYDYTYVLLFNIFFSSLQIFAMGILDQDVSDKVSLAVPRLYRRGIERKEWTQTKFWIYMLDGVYQAVVCFFITYEVFGPATFVTSNGLGVNDTTRIGLYVACSAVIAVNIYMLLNTYRWDWLTLLIVALSILFIYFWSGVYSAFTSAVFFYKAAPQVFAQASFWATVVLTVIICLLPRFTIKAVQKAFFPYDIDIIREQVRQGMYDHLEMNEPGFSTIQPSTIMPLKTDMEKAHSQNKNDRTDHIPNRQSLEEAALSADQPRPSFDRIRASMDRVRPSFEANNSFTSAALLARVESSHSLGHGSSRRENVPSNLR